MSLFISRLSRLGNIINDKKNCIASPIICQQIYNMNQNHEKICRHLYTLIHVFVHSN